MTDLQPLPSAADMVAFAAEVCQEYERTGWNITLRQLYYQGVTRLFLPSGQKSYKALMSAVASARLAGKFPLHALSDRTRRVIPGRSTRCDTKVDRALGRAAEAVRQMPEQLLYRDRWFGQPNHVSVWFEKEALAEVFETATERLGVSCFSCRGEPSHPSLFEWITTAVEAHGVDNAAGYQDKAGSFRKGMAKRSVILYFGDHDPTGIRIPRTAERTVGIFMGHMGLDFPVEFRRVGITLDQALAMNLPPFPAKESSQDYDKYVEEFDTTDAWELDALMPDVTIKLVEQAIGELFDKELYRKLQADIESRRDEMRTRLQSPTWHAEATRFWDQ